MKKIKWKLWEWTNEQPAGHSTSLQRSLSHFKDLSSWGFWVGLVFA